MKAIWIAFGVLALAILFLFLDAITFCEEISKLEHRFRNTAKNRPPLPINNLRQKLRNIG